MKKSLVLLSILSAFALSACGGGGGSGSTTSTTTGTTTGTTSGTTTTTTTTGTGTFPVSSYSVYALFGTGAQKGGQVSSTSATTATVALGASVSFDGVATPQSTTLTLNSNGNGLAQTPSGFSDSVGGAQAVELCEAVTSGIGGQKSMLALVGNQATALTQVSQLPTTVNFYNLEDCTFTGTSSTPTFSQVTPQANDYMTINTDGSATFYPAGGTAFSTDAASVTAALQTSGTGLASNGSAAYPSTAGTLGTAKWTAYSEPDASGSGTDFVIISQLDPTGGSTSSPNRGVLNVWFARQ